MCEEGMKGIHGRLGGDPVGGDLSFLSLFFNPLMCTESLDCNTHLQSQTNTQQQQQEQKRYQQSQNQLNLLLPKTLVLLLRTTEASLWISTPSSSHFSVPKNQIFCDNHGENSSWNVRRFQGHSVIRTIRFGGCCFFIYLESDLL